MSHALHINLRGKASIAYVEETPWHGLGQQLTRGAPIPVWAKEAGMDYTVQDAPVYYRTAEKAPLSAFPGRKALFRSDSGEPLGMVGTGYNVVQPMEVLEFFRDLVSTGGFELETAGVLYKGAKYWALARTGHDAVIGGKRSKDAVKGYLLLATACDGTLQTTAQFTATRVVCNNTLTAALLDANDKIGAIKVSHRTKFDEKFVKEKLGLDAGWTTFVEAADELTKIKVSEEKAAAFVASLLADPRHLALEGLPEGEKEKRIMGSRPVATVMQLFKGQGRGADMKSSAGTAWGLVNGISEYIDHLAGDSQDHRLKMAWFYDGNVIKRKAFDQALALAG